MSVPSPDQRPGGPLAGVKVLDFTRVLSGPYCTALLADLGADVVKVESPQGEEYRHIGPFRSGESALFQLVNRNKQSIVLDLKSPSGRNLVEQPVHFLGLDRGRQRAAPPLDEHHHAVLERWLGGV